MIRLVHTLMLLFAAAIMLAQAPDTTGVSSDTTTIIVPEPLPPDTAAAPVDTLHVPGNTRSGERDGLPPGGTQDTLTWQQRHSPRKATILSAVLPGAGQIYNRKYWKAPIVWGGLGVCYHFIRENTTEYQRYRTAYLALVDDDPNTTDEFDGRYAPAEVRRVMETYQRWRDISYIATAGVYILNIIDASVDAHFVRFDVSPELSMHVGPSLQVAALGGAGLSIGLVVR